MDASKENEAQKLSRVSRDTLHELGLEGIEVSPELIEDMKRLDANVISKETFLRRAIDRATQDE